ncbi:ABC transporter permease [Cumulibacter manganitolerans]|uniref:ABC transporter permease n=1 Tax=Cumulibacter manganitolerans TaxID=1884992 RepID=UPI001E2CEE32|nr:ABC transporter permease [Cumulibacter manganitolerans]
MTVDLSRAIESAPEEPTDGHRSRSLLADAGLWLGVAVLVLWILAAATIPLWQPFDPITDQSVANRLAAPNATHWFGTDSLGRDGFTRVIYGARLSLPIAAVAVVIAVLLGCLVGAVAGFAGKWADEILMRLCDVFLAFPAMVLALAIAAALGPSMSNVIVAIAAVTWPEYARLMRGQVLSIKDNLHVKAAESVGCSPARIFRLHVLPFGVPPIVVKATVDLGMAILLAAGLSFVGVGAAPPTAEWGSMIADASNHMPQWWLALFPGLAILTIVLAVNFIGDSLRDRLDPQVRAQNRSAGRRQLGRLLLGARMREGSRD